MVADASHEVAKSPDDVDVAGQHLGETGAARPGDGHDDGALIDGAGLSGNQALGLQEAGLMGQTAAAVDNAVGQFRHGQWPVGVDELGQNFELDITQAASRGVRAQRVFVRSDAEQLACLVARVDAGQLRLDIAERRPLSEIGAVHDDADTGRLPGKTVLTVS